MIMICAFYEKGQGPAVCVFGFIHFNGSKTYIDKCKVFHFVESAFWPTLQALKSVISLYYLDFWRAVQISIFLSTLSTPGIFGCNLYPLEEYCTEQGSLSHALSKMYSHLVSPSEDYRLPFLGRTFSKAQRTNIIYFTLNSSTCTRVQETNFKIFSQWYRTQFFLHKCFF